MIGVKIYTKPDDMAWTLQQWDELGLDTIFMGPKLRQEADFIAQVKASGRQLIAIFPVFYDKFWLQDHPEDFALTADGTQAVHDWVKFACPSSAQFMAHKRHELETVLATVQPDGVSLDFMRFFVYWEMVSKKETTAIVQTCFDERCLQRFAQEMAVVIPAELETVAEKSRWILEMHMDEWAAWKCGVIETAVSQLTTHTRSIDPGIKLGLHAVPWLMDEYEGAVHKVAGQDLGKLAQYVDFFTPMCYSHMVKENPAWVHDIVVGQAKAGGIPVLPSIQVEKAYREEDFAVDTFAQAIEAALQPPSAGILYWSWEALTRSAEKLALAKSLSPVKG